MRHASLSIVHRVDGAILLVWNPARNGWGLPGGKHENGETFRMTQERELLEETGLVTIYATEIYTAQGTDPEVLVHIFLVAARGTPMQMESGGTVIWAKPQSLREGPFAEFYTQMFEALGWRMG